MPVNLIQKICVGMVALHGSTNVVMFTLVLALQFWLTVSTETSKLFTLRDENTTNQTNSTSSDVVLSGEAIANIAATGAAIGIIAMITCYMCYCYNHRERMERIRTAIERNRVIRQRIAAEKAAAATQPNTTADNQTTSDINITSTESSR